jgi:Ni/Fe-hydrogenase subunit HybB-like protein
VSAGADTGQPAAAPRSREGQGLFRFLAGAMRPRGRILTPFNLVTLPVIILAAAIVVYRMAVGLGPVTNLSQDFPWGIWKGLNLITGVAFAGGAYTITFMVYVLGRERYRPLVRVTVLNGFLGYLFVALALVLELGRPWNVFNPIIGRAFGPNSVLFLVAWHFFLYTIAELIEFLPAAAEWLGWRRLRRAALAIATGTVIFGVTLSTLHQSGLGALFLLAKGKLHPLWYTELLPVLFFISSIFAGLSLVIIEGTVSRRVFGGFMDRHDEPSRDALLMGLGKVAAGALLVYLLLMILILLHGGHAGLLATPMGGLYLTEMLGFVLVPLLILVAALRRKSMGLLRAGAVVTAAGVVLNRLDVSLVAFNWNAPVRYVPTWMEVVVSLGMIFTGLWIFRWIVRRMPVLSRSPLWTEKGG